MVIKLKQVILQMELNDIGENFWSNKRGDLSDH